MEIGLIYFLEFEEDEFGIPEMPFRHVFILSRYRGGVVQQNLLNKTFLDEGRRVLLLHSNILEF